MLTLLVFFVELIIVRMNRVACVSKETPKRALSILVGIVAALGFAVNVNRVADGGIRLIVGGATLGVGIVVIEIQVVLIGEANPHQSHLGGLGALDSDIATKMG